MKTGTKIYLVLLIIGLAMIITSVMDALTLFKEGSRNISNLEMEDYADGDMVTGKVELVLDVVATLETSDTIYGIPYHKSETPYYLIWVHTDHDYGETYGYFMLLHAKKESTIKTLDNIMDDTYNFMTDETGNYVMNTKGLVVDTKCVSTPKEVRDYTKEYFDEVFPGYDDRCVMDVTLEQTDYGRTKMLPFLGLAVMVIPTIIFIASKKKTQTYKNSRTTYVNEGPSTESLMSEYGSAPAAGGGRRYNPDAYAGSTSENLGQMDEISLDDLHKDDSQ